MRWTPATEITNCAPCAKRSPPNPRISPYGSSLPRRIASADTTKIALEITRLAVARFPQSGDAQLALVRDLREVNRRSEAIGGLEAFLKAHPESGAEYYSWLGILRDESGLWPLGEPAHRKALELTPGADYLHNNLGYNLLMQDKNDEAAQEFQEALKLNPGSQMARNNLGIALAHSNATAQAVANWQSTSDPATAHNNLAAVWMEKGNYPEARQGTGFGPRL